MIANKLMSALSGGAEEKLYVDDVFSTYLYTGNGATQTINNGIDLAGKGGMVWIKRRDGSSRHWLFDASRPANVNGDFPATDSSSSDAEQNWQNIGPYYSNGFRLRNSGNFNSSGGTYASWTFRKAPKFFDVVTYTGNGVAGRQIPHALGIAPGMVIIKRTDAAGDWGVLHISKVDGSGYNAYLKLNTTDAAAGMAPSLAYSASTFQVQGFMNTSGGTYVAYLFAHDPSADGIIQCGSFTTDASGNATVNLGWEPQFILDRLSTTVDNWKIVDTSRDLNASSAPSTLKPNSANAEAFTNGYARVNATGFTVVGMPADMPVIYLAIRRPNKPPKTGWEVFSNAAGSQPLTFPAAQFTRGRQPDMAIAKNSTSSSAALSYSQVVTKAINVEILVNNADPSSGGLHLEMTSSNAESSSATRIGIAPAGLGYTDGAWIAGGESLGPTMLYGFIRAPGFFDVVCYTGTGVARTVPHSLGAAPELMIVKARNASVPWLVYAKPLGATNYLLLNQSQAKNTSPIFWNDTEPSSSVFSLETHETVNSTNTAYVAYLFASLPGISKVGSYTGNGTTQTINCGFTTGARFILVKRTDAVGNWYVWDTARGIISANDPHLSLNTTAVEVTTDDSVDPEASGFIVNQVAATNINVSGSQYIFLAIT